MRKTALHLIKDGHEYIFRYAPGSEDRIVDEIVRLVEDERTNLDWLDAANLSYQITQYAADECSRQMRAGVGGARDGTCPNFP
ncbi:MAG TPA: hypothetical protein VMZ50_01610 [Phycisphaerae bacterium]|nr:hypothetical protein [Phycisphaerae bacterium]